jgi:hypothetical protein
MSDDAPVSPLTPDRLYRAADIAALDFATTRELAPLREFADQPRAHEAIRFGTEMAVRGFNIFAIGAIGAHIQGSVRALEDTAGRREKPSDWVYVNNNFTTPHRPVAIALPSGRAPALDKALSGRIDDLKGSLPAAFESEEYQKRRGAIEQEARGRNERAFSTVRDNATAKGVAILRTPMGFAMAPMKDGQVVQPVEFNAWPTERQQEVQAAIEELEKDLEDRLRGLPRLEREQRDAVRALDREIERDPGSSAVVRPHRCLRAPGRRPVVLCVFRNRATSTGLLSLSPSRRRLPVDRVARVCPCAGYRLRCLGGRGVFFPRRRMMLGRPVAVGMMAHAPRRVVVRVLGARAAIGALVARA